MNETDYTLEDAEDAVRYSMSADDRQTRYEHDGGCKGLRFILDALEAAQGNEVSLATAAADARHERNVATDALAAAEQRIAELEQCAAFVQWVRQEWHHDGDIDGGALQDALTECGLLTPTEVHAPCDPEACQCAEYGEFPVVCYRWADAARQEAAP